MIFKDPNVPLKSVFRCLVKIETKNWEEWDYFILEFWIEYDSYLLP